MAFFRTDGEFEGGANLDEPMLLDGTVGGIDDLQAAPPAPAGVLHVFVSGDGVSGSRAPRLAKDLEQLIQTFIERPISSIAEEARVSERLRPSELEEIEIALHGLGLEPDDEAELRHLIRARVVEHLTNDEASE